MSAPSAAPGMLPSPPITTTAKARTITSTPIPGTTDTVGAVSAPPIAASIVPTVKVTRNILLTSMPMAALSSSTPSGRTLVAAGRTTGDWDAAVWERPLNSDRWQRVCTDETVCGDKFPGGGNRRQTMWSVTGLRHGGFVAVGSDVVDGFDATVWLSYDGITWSRARQDPVLGGPRDQEMRSVIDRTWRLAADDRPMTRWLA